MKHSSISSDVWKGFAKISDRGKRYLFVFLLARPRIYILREILVRKRPRAVLLLSLSVIDWN
jgi:hypothetical protein